MRSESLSAPIVINHDLATFMTRLSPVIDGLTVIANDVAMTNAVRRHQPSIEELKSLLTASGSGNDLDWPAFKLAITTQATRRAGA